LAVTFGIIAVPARWFRALSRRSTEYGFDPVTQLPLCEIINCTDCRLRLRGLFYHPPASPVWTLHDMNAFTGGCHYDCGARYMSGCNAYNCSSDPSDLSEIVEHAPDFQSFIQRTCTRRLSACWRIRQERVLRQISWRYS
jgi:hypothetical protein